MGKIIIRNLVEKEKGKLYYIDGKGNVCEAKMQRGGTKKRKWKRKYTTQEQKEEMTF